MIKKERTHIIKCMLKIDSVSYYKVKKGEDVHSIAKLFCLPESLLVKANALTKEVEEGEVLKVPDNTGNLYTVKLGDRREAFFESEEAFEKKNGTRIWFVGQRIFL